MSFVWQNTPQPRLALPGLHVEPLVVHPGGAKVDLTLEMEETADGIAASVEYRSALFRDDTIARLAAQFVELLDAAVAAPLTRVRELRLLSSAERERVIRQATGECTAPPELLLHQLFERQAAITPDAIAAVDQAKSLSYRGLDALTSRWAQALRARGVAADDLVGVALGRGVDLLAAYLAILKAGAGFVPLDLGYPRARLRMMIGRCGASRVVTDLATAIELELPDSRIVLVEDLADSGPTEACPAEAAFGRRRTSLDVPATAAAYGIFTSGSTGAPNCVTVSHAAIASTLAWRQRWLPLGPDDRVLQAMSPSFDPSVWEFFAPLAAGGRVVLTLPAGVEGRPLIGRQLVDEGITQVQTTSSQLAVLLDDPLIAQARSLRRIMCGAEPLPRDLQQRVFDLPGVELYNLYGPTEAAIDVTAFRCSPADPEPFASIGGPIDGARACLVDETAQLVPQGAVGEIAAGGRGVARGYVGQPRLTAARFTPDPLAGEGPSPPGARVYRTGDRARWTSHGTLRFLGRGDTQVKIGGVRVELGEVESLLQGEDLVERVCVSREIGAKGQAFLAAYVQPARGALAGRSREALVEALRDRAVVVMPPTLRPSRWVIVDAMPLTPNGKVDRRALSALDAAAPAAARRAPDTVLQRTLAWHWQDLLGGDEPGLDDDFFAAGGHSLTATALSARLTQLLNVDVPVRTIFEHPTLATLCAALELERFPSPQSGALPSRTSDRTMLSSGQRRLWFLEQLEADAGAAYQMTARFRLEPAVDPSALGKAIEVAAARHDLLRARLVDDKGEPVFHIAATIAAGDVLVVHSSPRPVAAAGAPIRLSAWPLWRIDLWPANGGASELEVTVHHLIADAASMGILLNELVTVMSGRAVDLPLVRHRYGDYVRWLERRWPAAERDAALGRWRQRLDGAPALLDLPLDKRRPPRQSFAGDSITLEIEPASAAGLEKLARGEKATPFVAWLSLVAAVLGRQAGADDLVLGVPVANRARPETRGVIGFFLNTLPLRLRPRGTRSFLDLVRETREQVVAALADAELPFEYVVDAVRPARDLSHSPIFQVLMTHDVESLRDDRVAPGLAVQPIVEPGTRSQFDLSIHVRNTHVTLEYCTALFSRETIAELGRTMVAAAESVRDHPDTPLAQLSFLAPGESGRLLAAWNASSVDGAAANQPATIDRRSVVERVDAVSRAVPDRIAIEMRATTPDARVRPARLVSYRALRMRAAAIAAVLRDRALPAESLVAIALDREADFLPACLAVWQLGHAVLPLDPRHPRARLDAILDDSDAAMVISEEDLRAVPQSAPPVAGRALLPESLAYVLYTSGSTGRPKGVQISHGALASFLGAIEARLPLSPGEELLALTTCMFDISFLEVLLPLVRGATTVLLEHDSTVDPRRLAAAIEGGRTRLVQATPSHWRMLVDSGWRGADDLVVACGGERLDTDLSAALVERSRELWNLYGPTETTIWSSSYLVRAAGPGASEPIGAPLDNTRLYLLDGRLEPVRPGAAGELYIGGEALARGYRGQRALTAERFIPDPWSRVPGARMYRTGDLVTFSADAGIRFLRRQDNQVKVRGHRIELSEIEQAARQHPLVADAIAVVQETGRASGASLALHVLLRDPSPEPPAATAAALRDLRDHLRQALPEYMVPPLMARLDAMPLTPNGKTDRARLTPIEPADEGPLASQSIQEPLALELRAIWEDVLGEGSGNAAAGFFELGGNSLAAARLIHLIEERLSIRLPVAALFEHSTERALLSILRDRTTSVHAPALVTLRKGTGAPLFVFPGAGGNSVYFHALSRALPTKRAVIGVQAVGLDGDVAPHETVAEMAAHAFEQVRRVQPAGPYLLLGHSLGGRVAFDVARRLEAAGERVALLGVLDTPAPLPGAATAAASARDLADDLAWLDEIKEIVAATTGRTLELDSDALRSLSDDARIAAVAAKLAETGLLLDGRLARGFIGVYQAAVRTSYEASGPIAAPIALLRVERPDRTGVEGAAWGWETLTTAGARSVIVPGGHISMLMPPHVGELASRLAEILGAESAGASTIA